jgi:hypothetical protein
MRGGSVRHLIPQDPLEEVVARQLTGSHEATSEAICRHALREGSPTFLFLHLHPSVKDMLVIAAKVEGLRFVILHPNIGYVGWSPKDSSGKA